MAVVFSIILVRFGLPRKLTAYRRSRKLCIARYYAFVIKRGLSGRCNYDSCPVALPTSGFLILFGIASGKGARIGCHAQIMAENPKGFPVPLAPRWCVSAAARPRTDRGPPRRSRTQSRRTERSSFIWQPSVCDDGRPLVECGGRKHSKLRLDSMLGCRQRTVAKARRRRQSGSFRRVAVRTRRCPRSPRHPKRRFVSYCGIHSRVIALAKAAGGLG